MNIGNLIKEYRTKHKMTMQEFADVEGSLDQIKKTGTCPAYPLMYFFFNVFLSSPGAVSRPP